MVILTKKKIIYILEIICIVAFLCLILGNVIGKKEKKLKSIQTVSMPADRKIIILDAGHGRPDERRRKQKPE